MISNFIMLFVNASHCAGHVSVSLFAFVGGGNIPNAMIFCLIQKYNHIIHPENTLSFLVNHFSLLIHLRYYSFIDPYCLTPAKMIQTQRDPHAAQAF